MVNSKKMSKSTVAIVLLSLLLVLSLILTATGAWFTASADKSADGANASWSISDFITVSVTGTDDSSIKAYTKLGEDQTKTEVEANGKLFPADTIEITDGAKFTVSASAKTHKFYYVVSKDNGATWDVAAAGKADLFDGTSENLVLKEYTLEATVSGTLEEANRPLSNGVITINEKLTDVAAGKTVVVEIAGVNIIVRAIQYNNLTAADAYTKLTGDFANVNA